VITVVVYVHYEDIYKLLSQQRGADEVELTRCELRDDLGVDRDDFDELMGSLADRFGGHVGPSYDQIAVTPSLLLVGFDRQADVVNRLDSAFQVN
jgi:hypothetical protein